MTKRLIFFCLAALAFGTAQAQTTTVVSTANDAFNIAEGGVDARIRDRIVSVYGEGTPGAVQTWWVIFYDPSVASHGRAVKVDAGKITRTYEAKGGVVYSYLLTFQSSQLAGEGPALAAAQNYAVQHNLSYDNVRVLLRNTTGDEMFRWRVQLFNGSTSKGFVFANATDGKFSMYAPPEAIPAKGGSSTGGVAGEAHNAADEVKNTFLGIGGDLQEFFTGERTVDQ